MQDKLQLSVVVCIVRNGNKGSEHVCFRHIQHAQFNAVVQTNFLGQVSITFLSFFLVVLYERMLHVHPIEPASLISLKFRITPLLFQTRIISSFYSLPHPCNLYLQA